VSAEPTPTDRDGRYALALKYAATDLVAPAWDLLQHIARAVDAPPPVLRLAAHLRAAAGAHADALMFAERGLADTPDDPALLLLRGVALCALGRLDAGIAAYRHGLSVAPASAALWNNLGLALEAGGAAGEAAAAFEQAIARDPGAAEPRANLGALYAAAGRFAAAAAACRAALDLAPGNLPARINLAAALTEQGRHREATEVLAPAADRPQAADTALYLWHYSSDDPAAAVAAHKAWGAGQPAPGSVARRPSAGRRMRIGYLSGDFRRHSVSYFFAPLLAGHDRTRVEVFCYANGGIADDVTRELKASADHWADIAALDDDTVCAKIRDDRLDVLVDLSGHTQGNRLGVFARRAAPVQVTALGYPGTTGLAQIDYRLCDAITDPPGTDAFAAERLLRLPRLHCYRPEPAAPAPAPLPALAAGHITFGSFNKLGKVSDATVALWARVLAAVPRSRLFLKSKALAEEEVRRDTVARFAAAGVSAERLTLFGWVPEDAGHLAAYGRVDVALDTFPYSGTTTTCEALWMGVPVVTLSGATHASRVSASLLTAVGMTDWIADSPAALVARATAAAADPAGLAQLRTELRPRVASSPLCDAAGYAAAVEAAFRAM
jgi:predicted O-linked N-acetylglucosamine transferase (SPINDLY family)